MASFSNTDTGSKPADPYTAANNAEPSSEEKIGTLERFIDTTKYGMLTTRDSTSGKLVSRCMAVAAKETAGLDLLFFTNTESHKTDELKSDPNVNVSFLDSSGQWASVAGTATVETDRSLVSRHYSPTLKAWLGDLGDGKHDGSESDPRIGVIRVKVDTANYSVTDKTIIGRVAEIVKGTVTGDVASVNKLIEVTESEVQQWRTSH
ncbi:putative BLI-3 blue-light-inducible Bli-3 protein [Xylariales sp. PMI_506]|nr:putative BLI-3 blue-light-inducible Bli-3 protein [Xylariales sp. PMI_506]